MFVGYNSTWIYGMERERHGTIALLSIACTLSLCINKGQGTLFYPNNSYTSNNNNDNNNNKRLLIIVMRTILVSKDCRCLYLSCLQYPGFSFLLFLNKYTLTWWIKIYGEIYCEREWWMCDWAESRKRDGESLGKTSRSERMKGWERQWRRRGGGGSDKDEVRNRWRKWRLPFYLGNLF